MEIPDLEELQWLEANSHAQLQEEEDYPLDLEPEQEQGEGDGRSLDEEFEFQALDNLLPSVDSNKNKKRPRSIELDPESDDDDSRVNKVQNVVDDSRVRVRVNVQSDDDDSRVRVNVQSDDDDSRVRVKVQSDDENSISNKKYLSRYASEIDGECMPVTAPSGERVYALLDTRVFTPPGHGHEFKMPGTLVSEPVSVLLQKAEQDALIKALQASSEVQNDLFLPETSTVTEELWVNKYAPKSFTELLSDEHTNREVLIWLKHWDSAVFGTDIRNTGEEVLSALRRHSTIPHHKKHSDTSFMRKNRGPRLTENYTGHSATLEQEIITTKGVQGLQNKRPRGSETPEQKVLLLCGPPGLGKTTLAHVVAKHCGYHVMEINASDDRSSTVIEAKMLDAMQMNSVMADSKPKCLVIDEIDGALGEGKGAVEIIAKMVAAERKSYVGKETSTIEGLSGSSSLKKGRKAVSLSRPVICICNDLYAPSLRPLRPIAKVHVFAQPTVSRVVSRLKYICNKEGVKTSSIALTALAEYTDCDVRSCLNTLQFLQKKKEALSLGALSSQVVGRKDMTRSVFDIWREVFQKRKIKQTLRHDASQVKTYDAHDSLYSMISYRGDYELIADGIHENFLRLHYHDPMLQKTVDCLNALGLSDLLHQCFMRSHNTFLYVYHPPIIITMHRLLANVERPNIEWPKSFQRCRMLLMEKIEMLRSWQSKVPPYISRHLSVHSFVEDTVSSLLHILSPAGLRPVALHLLSEKEKNDLAQLVSTMVSYSLTYKKTKFDPSTNNSIHDGVMDASSLSLDPPIEDFVSFKDIKPGHHELKSAVKQVILHEVEKQKIVQESTARFVNPTDNSRKENNAASCEENGLLVSSKVHNAASVGFSIERKKNMQQEVISKSIVQKRPSSSGFGGRPEVVKLNSTKNEKSSPTGPFNFFDRFKNSGHKGLRHVDSSAEKTTEDRDGHPLLFKFNEGFTNAVKKPVRVREFLL